MMKVEKIITSTARELYAPPQEKDNYNYSVLSGDETNRFAPGKNIFMGEKVKIFN